MKVLPQFHSLTKPLTTMWYYFSIIFYSIIKLSYKKKKPPQLFFFFFLHKSLDILLLIQRHPSLLMNRNKLHDGTIIYYTSPLLVGPLS